MKTTIGNRTVAALTPKARPYDVRDTKLKGFLVRVQPSGIMAYAVQYGRGKRITLGRVGVLTPAQARDEAVRVLADVTRGLDPLARRKARQVDTFGDYLSREYGPWVEAHRKDGKATLARLRACFGEFGSKTLIEITPWLIDKWRATRRKEGIAPATVNRDLVALKAALSKAVDWCLIDAHPLKDVKPVKVDSAGVVRYLDEQEEIHLRHALAQREERIRSERDSANAWRAERGYTLLTDLRSVAFADHLQPLVLLAMNTGLRRGELFTLTWDCVDLECARLTVEAQHAKNGKARHVPLNNEALTVLKGWRAHFANRTGLVFPGRGGKPLDNVNSAWEGLLKEAGIVEFRFHDLRHHFASRLVMAGVDLNTVRELLGHGDIKMTLRYAHLAPEHKAAAVAKLTNRI